MIIKPHDAIVRQWGPYEVIKAKVNGTKKVTHNIEIMEIGADKTLQKILK